MRCHLLQGAFPDQPALSLGQGAASAACTLPLFPPSSHHTPVLLSAHWSSCPTRRGLIEGRAWVMPSPQPWHTGHSIWSPDVCVGGKENRKRPTEGEAGGTHGIPDHRPARSQQHPQQAGFPGAVPDLQGCRAHPTLCPSKPTCGREGGEEGAQGDAAAVGPSALCPPEPGAGGPRFGLPGPPAGRALHTPPRHQPDGKRGERHTCGQGNLGDPDFFQEIAVASQAEAGGCLAAPALQELFQPILVLLASPSAQTWGPQKTGASLPRKVTLAIRSPLPRSSETVLRWTSRAMLAWEPGHCQAGAAEEGASSGDGARLGAHASLLSPAATSSLLFSLPRRCCPQRPRQPSRAAPSSDPQRLTALPAPAPPSCQPSVCVSACMCVCAVCPVCSLALQTVRIHYSAAACSQIKACPASGVSLQLWGAELPAHPLGPCLAHPARQALLPATRRGQKGVGIRQVVGWVWGRRNFRICMHWTLGCCTGVSG